MSNQRKQAGGRAHLWRWNNVLAVVIFVALTGTAVAAGGEPESSSGGGPEASASVVTDKKFKKLKRMVAGLTSRLAALEAKPAVTTASPTGPAGGALAGTYPNPTLDVSGGPCPNGEALTNVSALAALTCAPGVYSDGVGNVAAGATSFPALTIGQSNSALGSGALAANTTGCCNSAVGEDALASNTNGLFNSAVGRFALDSNDTGTQNSALGTEALGANTSGDFNSALGIAALFNNTTGDGNTALGTAAGQNLTTGNNNIDIANDGAAGESGTTRIGTDLVQTRAFIAGISGVTTGGAAVPVLIDGAGQLGTASSSRRAKRDIRPLGALKPLMRLRPVSFRYRTGSPELHYGLIAEQVARVLPALAVRGADGLPETVQYQELPVLLLGALQRQQREKDALQAQVRRQQAQVRRQQAQIDWLIRQARSR